MAERALQGSKERRLPGPTTWAVGTLAVLGMGLAAALTSEQWTRAIGSGIQAADTFAHNVVGGTVLTFQQTGNVIAQNAHQLELLGLAGFVLVASSVIGSIGAPDAPN